MAESTLIPAHWLLEAQRRVQPSIRHTPLAYDSTRDIYLKWENQQVTGSFKIRGAVNKVLTLQPWEREQGLVAASAGNHGQGVALAGNQADAAVVIFASQNAVPAKIEAMRDLGADVRLVPGGYEEAEKAGLDFATKQGMTWISPYNDGQVIAGQGTLGLEILSELPDGRSYTWLVPVGGGGLASGIGAALQASGAPAGQHRLVGVQSEASPFGYMYFKHRSQEGAVELPSLADGLAGPVEPGSITLPLLRKFLDDFVLVSEADIHNAISAAWQHWGERVEGAGAVGLAAVLSGKVSARPAVVVISGGNIQPEVHQIITGS